MEHFPEILTPDQSRASAERIRRHFEEQGWGLWALALREDGKFIGFTGLQAPSFEAHFTPCVEIGWRLSAEHWGHGYAPEAATVALSFAFEQLGLTEVVSMTATQNLRSRRVMEKLEMTYDPADDFENPLVPIGHRVRRHVLYRKKKDSRPYKQLRLTQRARADTTMSC
jgi:ribosomal-protein-alanine N-acetyltransferase